MKWILVVLFVTLCVMVRARHIHTHHTNADQMVDDDNTDVADILSVKPTRFVPINNVFYFKDFEPCEEGYVRDRLGVCRELWN